MFGKKREEKKEIKKLKKEQKEFSKLDKKKYKKAKKNVKKSVSDIFNILDFEDDLIKTKNGYMNIFQIQSKDIYSFNSDESCTHIYEFARLLRTYQDDIKLVTMNFPVNTFKQQRYVVKKQNKTENEAYKKILDQKLRELVNLEKTRNNKEFYIFTYANDLKQESDQRHMLKRLSSSVLTILDVDTNKKKQILFKLNNQNTKIIPK